MNTLKSLFTGNNTMDLATKIDRLLINGGPGSGPQKGGGSGGKKTGARTHRGSPNLSSDGYMDAGEFSKGQAKELAKHFGGKAVADASGKYLVQVGEEFLSQHQPTSKEMKSSRKETGIKVKATKKQMKKEKGDFDLFMKVLGAGK